MEKAREHQQPLYFCFVDFQKAFDSIPHDKLWITMLDMGYPTHLVNLLMNLYRKQFAKIRVAGTLSECFRVRKGVRQGCVLSPYLFNIIAEMVMRETLDRYTGELQIGGRHISNLRYADDIVLIATSQQELQELVDRLHKTSGKYGLMLNKEKMKVMSTEDNTCMVYVDKKVLEQVDNFCYLGSLSTNDAKCAKEIKSRLSKGQYISAGLKRIRQSHDIAVTTKVKLL